MINKIKNVFVNTTYIQTTLEMVYTFEFKPLFKPQKSLRFPSFAVMSKYTKIVNKIYYILYTIYLQVLPLL